MMKENKKEKWLRRSFLFALTMLFAIICISAISRVLGYYNTGTEPGDALNLNPRIILDHTPSLEWLDADPRVQEDLGQNKFLLKEIQENYINSWYLMNLSIKNGVPISLEDNFSKIPRNTIALSTLSLNEKPEIEVRRVDLSHTLKLNWMAPDLQICGFEDYNVQVIKRIIDPESKDIIDEEWMHMDLQIVMTLEDGRWRIRHMVVDSIDAVPIDTSLLYSDRGYIAAIDDIKGVNYYPRSTPWHDFWEEYNDTIIRSDFRLIDSLGFNTIRVFIPYEHFGKGNVNIKEVEKLEELLDIAESNNLKVIVTLFDFLYYFDIMNYSAIDRQIEIVAERLKNKPALLAWDIKNEPDLDFQHYGKDRVERWLDFVIQRLRSYDDQTPITIGWLDPMASTNFHNKVDFISFHYYEDPDLFDESILQLRDSIDIQKTVLVEEFGLATYNLLVKGNTEVDQAEYYDQILTKISSEPHTSFALWTLYDFEDIPNQVVGPLPWKKIPQKGYGLIKIDSTAKQSLMVVQKFLVQE